MNCIDPAKQIVDEACQGPRLAVIRYAPSQGTRADLLFVELAQRLASRSIGLAGAVQHNAAHAGRSCCDMMLEDLGTGTKIAISRYRGPLARGCRLDSAALEEAVGLASHALESGARLLIINKFGKRECEGGGFRSLIDDAVARGVPVLAAVNDASASGWAEYAQGYCEDLPLDIDAVERWCSCAIRPDQA